MNISDYRQCANCGACYNICPQNAITVKEDGLFYTPTVNRDLCIDCSACAAVCPVNQTIGGNSPIAACAGWHKEEKIVLNSSSGGAFSGMAKEILAQDGVVYAAVFGKDCKSVEFASSDEVPLENMLKSKYVESCVGFSFRNIKTALETGRKVLFCGTPCQVAGLHGYLGKNYEHLITCDFACGGLPSHALYREHIEDLERKYGAEVESVDFRPKTHGWKRYALRIKFGNGREYLRLGTEDPFLRSFLHGKYTVRDDCLRCKFPEHHMSDITIADFWLHQKLSSLENENGISLILCNTEKGKQLIDAVKEHFIMTDIDLYKASYNNRIRMTEDKADKHNAFLQCCEKEGFASACQNMLPLSRRSRLRDFLVRKLRRTRRKP